MKCVFCELPANRVEDENEVAVLIRDAYPVSLGHCLAIPRRHVASLFETTEEERAGLFDLIDRARSRIDREIAPDGYNVGVNVGRAAGQTIFHLHVHLIPRFQNDVQDPTGGVRGVIPGKARYGD